MKRTVWFLPRNWKAGMNIAFSPHMRNIWINYKVRPFIESTRLLELQGHPSPRRNGAQGFSHLRKRMGEETLSTTH